MAVRGAEPGGGSVLSGRERLFEALAGAGTAFAPIVWERLPALVHQEQRGWWQDPTTGQRLIGDAAALAAADAMFVCAADEAVRAASARGLRGDGALDALGSTPEAKRGVELVRCLRGVAAHGVIAAVPPPASLQRAFGGEELEAAEDAFTDLVSAYLDAGADAVAVTGEAASDVRAGMRRASQLTALYGRAVLGVSVHAGEASAWDEHGAPLAMISAAGEWPARASWVS